MAHGKTNYYEILGVKQSAKHNDIHLAYNRLVAARKRESAAPDLKQDTMIREAFAVLSDLDRRAAYDAELARARLKPAFGAKQGAFAAVAIAAIAGAVWYFAVRKPAQEAAQVVGKTPEEIVAAATPAIGRLSSMEMSGVTTPLGVAFAVDSGVMVASCHGIPPNAQLAVNFNPRVVPARVTLVDEERGLCKLEVEGAGSWPLSISGAEARPGDRVYATTLNAVGQVMLTQATVKSLPSGAQGKIVDSTLPAATFLPGAPMLDAYGRVVAVATEKAGEKRYVVIPASWTQMTLPATPSAVPTGTPNTEPRPAPSMPNAPGSFTPERVEKLDKAFRPPPVDPDAKGLK